MSIGFAQDSIPQIAKTHFDSTYPGATNVEWDIENDNIEVEFELKVKTLLFKARISGVEIFKAETGQST